MEYDIVFQPIKHQWEFCHFLADDFNARMGQTFHGSYVRHHVDFNKHNNNPNNIVRMTFKDHWKLHSDQVKTTNKLGITGFTAMERKYPGIIRKAALKMAEKTWHGENAEQNKINASIRTKIRNKNGSLNTPKQREKTRQRQLINNSTKFREQNKDVEFQQKQKLGRLKHILQYCNNDFSKESYNEARKNVYNAYTFEKALEILRINNITFEELVGYKNHKVLSITTITEPTEVYCLTCQEFGNFALASGVFVHNCGMLVVNLGKKKIDLPALDKFIRTNIPSGSNVNEIQGTRVEFPELEDMKMYKNLRNIKHLQSSIGSLGGGNHFIELDKDYDDNVWLVIHTGSRNLGQQVCKHYQKLAVDQCNGKTKQIKDEIKTTIDKLKAEGRQRESSEAIKAIKAKYQRVDGIPQDLCYLTDELREDYLHDMKICQEFAIQNREEIAKRILKHLKLHGCEYFHTVHNYIDFTDNTIRKGAIRCNAGELVIIPLNMRDGSILAQGKGNEDWNCSGPHGAGRLMSRREAKESISMKDFKASMEGIYTTSVNHGTLDESPMAYKNAQEIIDAVQETVDIIDIIKPIYNFKASETEEYYKR